MSKENYLPRLRLILSRLEKGPATYTQINSFLQRESEINGEDYTISLRTLQRDITFINNQLDYEIINERTGDKRYLIKSKPESHNMNQRLLDSYHMINLIKLSQNFQEHIFLETRRSKGLEHFPGIHYAIITKKVVTFNYYKYWEDITSKRTVNPIALKEARGRWYLIAEDHKDNKLKTFGLDRMDELDITKIAIRNAKKYNVNEIFYHSFGIMNDEKLIPQKVILSFNYEQGQYLKNYPLHSSQEIIKEEGDKILFELTVRITYDFIMELLSYGSEVKILKPVNLIKEVCSKYSKAYNQYNSINNLKNTII